MEVVSSHRGRGIGSELVSRVARAFGPIYGTYLCCDENTLGFYERLGFDRIVGMVLHDTDAARTTTGREEL